MNRIGRWIALDLVLAIVVAILGNIVASYLQERFIITNHVRFLSVAVLFAICLAASLFVTLKRYSTPTGAQSSINGRKRVQVRQRVKRIKPESFEIRVVAAFLEATRLIHQVSVKLNHPIVIFCIGLSDFDLHVTGDCT